MQITSTRLAWPAKTELRITLDCSRIANEIVMMSGLFVEAKVEFPIGEKLFHLVVNPGTWRCPTMDLELVQNYEKRKWNTTFRSEFPTRKTGPPF